MYNKEPAAAETAAAETAAAETASAMVAPDVNEQTEDTADVVKQKREVNGTADAEVRTLQAENLYNIRVIDLVSWLRIDQFTGLI